MVLVCCGGSVSASSSCAVSPVKKSHSSSLQEVTDPSVMTSFLHHVHLKIETLRRSALFLVYFHAPLFPSFTPKGTRLQVGTRLRRGPYCSASSAYASAPVCWLLAIHKSRSPPFTQRSRHTKLTLGLFWGVRRIHLWLSAPMAEGLVLGVGAHPRAAHHAHARQRVPLKAAGAAVGHQSISSLRFPHRPLPEII